MGREKDWIGEAHPTSKRRDKMRHILSATAEVVAQVGDRATTQQISSRADVSVGLLFRYFANKEALLNTLYLYLNDVLRASVSEIDEDMPALTAIRSFWREYVSWGIANPVNYMALRKLSTSHDISPGSRALGAGYFRDVLAMCDRCASCVDAESKTPEHVQAMLIAAADATIEFCLDCPERADALLVAGLAYIERLWLPGNAQSSGQPCAIN